MSSNIRPLQLLLAGPLFVDGQEGLAGGGQDFHRENLTFTGREVSLKDGGTELQKADIEEFKGC